MKGKDTFTIEEIKNLEELIVLRNKALPSKQKAIRDKMRKIGFFGKDDWGITDLKISDLHSLIKSSQIKVIGGSYKPISPSTPLKQVEKVAKQPTQTTSISTSSDLKSILERFKLNHFDPQIHPETKIHDAPGNYIICLRKDSLLPIVAITPALKKFEGLDTIYTGIAGGSLRKRDYRQHFTGNAGRSTLRKSLGVLFGYKQIPRDKDPNTGKSKFSDKDEQKLTEWMHSNLIMFFLPTLDFDIIEIYLINHFNPPLNLKDNSNSINSEFRRYLSKVRSNK